MASGEARDGLNQHYQLVKICADLSTRLNWRTCLNSWVLAFRGTKPIKLVYTTSGVGRQHITPRVRKLADKCELYHCATFVTNGVDVWRWGKWRNVVSSLDVWVEKYRDKFEELN